MGWWHAGRAHLITERPIDRAALREAVRSAYPWVELPDRGPASVEAGECERCGAAPRLLPTCGPVAWTALCRSCGLQLGPEAWCEGHAEVAADLLAWVRELPDEWPTVCRVWWIATGEVRIAHPVVGVEALPAAVTAMLDRGG